MSNRIVYTQGVPDLLGASGNSSPIALYYPIYEAIVTDVVLDTSHEQYSEEDGISVGMIQVRILNVHDTIDSDLLDWAHPMDNTIFQYPLKGEFVIIHKLRNELFYTIKVPFAGRIQENGLLNLNRDLDDRFNNTLSEAVKSEEELTLDSHEFGEYFRPDSRVRQLLHFEGDTLIQGRMGHSIRLGSSKMDNGTRMAPNIILRTGQGKDIEQDSISIDSPFGYIMEDINKDASSIWMVSDQNIPFVPSVKEAGSRYRSIETPPQKYGGASIILNSDRIVLNSKKTHILLFSNEEIHLGSFKRTSIDTDDSIMLTANLDIVNRSSRNIEFRADVDYSIEVGGDFVSTTIGSTSFLSNKIFIGSVDDDKEPLVGGTSLSIFLGRLLIALMGIPPLTLRQNQKFSRIPMPRTLISGPAATAHVITPMGPGLLNPLIQRELRKLYSELSRGRFKNSPFNSEDNFVNLQNVKPEVELNEFEDGDQLETENNEWVLGESYYKVV